MTRTEFRLQAYLNCIDAVTKVVMENSYPNWEQNELATTIALTAEAIADKSVEAMNQHLGVIYK